MLLDSLSNLGAIKGFIKNIMLFNLTKQDNQCEGQHFNKFINFLHENTPAKINQNLEKESENIFIKKNQI